jgi:hypothetical protein
MFWGAPANDVITRASPSIGGIERAHRATSMPLGADERLWERGAPDWRSPDAAQNAETFGADAVEELLASMCAACISSMLKAALIVSHATQSADMKASQEAGQRPGMGGNKVNTCLLWPSNIKSCLHWHPVTVHLHPLASRF